MLKGEELNKKAGETVLALFTDDQKNAWKGMLGEPFKFPAPARAALR